MDSISQRKGFTLNFTVENSNIQEIFNKCKEWLEKKRIKNIKLEPDTRLTGRYPFSFNFTKTDLPKEIEIKLHQKQSDVQVSLTFRRTGSFPGGSKYNYRWVADGGWMMQRVLSSWIKEERDLKEFLISH